MLRYPELLSGTTGIFSGATMIRSGNPALRADTFSNAVTSYNHGNDAMTLSGTVNKSFIVITALLISAGFVWNLHYQASPMVGPLLWGGVIGSFIVALVTIFKKEWSPLTAPLYGVLEGLALGGISAMADMRFPGIVIQAAALTMGVFVALLFAYKSGLIKPTENFKLGVAAATGGIAVMYLISMVMRMFGSPVAFLHDSSLLSIGISAVVIIVAALNLVLDFDFIEEGANRGNTPKYMEWYAAFGLTVTLAWLYLEILRLLMKLKGRD